MMMMIKYTVFNIYYSRLPIPKSEGMTFWFDRSKKTTSFLILCCISSILRCWSAGFMVARSLQLAMIGLSGRPVEMHQFDGVWSVFGQFCAEAASSSVSHDASSRRINLPFGTAGTRRIETSAGSQRAVCCIFSSLRRSRAKPAPSAKI